MFYYGWKNSSAYRNANQVNLKTIWTETMITDADVLTTDESPLSEQTVTVLHEVPRVSRTTDPRTAQHLHSRSPRLQPHG